SSASASTGHAAGHRGPLMMTTIGHHSRGCDRRPAYARYAACRTGDADHGATTSVRDDRQPGAHDSPEPSPAMPALAVTDNSAATGVTSSRLGSGRRPPAARQDHQAGELVQGAAVRQAARATAPNATNLTEGNHAHVRGIEVRAAPQACRGGILG